MNVLLKINADTGELLDRFQRQADEEAFRELVKRYSGLVFGVAMRRMENNTRQAEEVAQSVFIQLAQHARRVSGEGALGGWLHRVTCRIASNLRRSESRRRIRESAMSIPEPDDSNEIWQQLSPVLDAALDRLDAADREPIVLRYFENRSLREIAIVLHLSEEAAKKRVQRALEKLRRLIAKRGLALSAAVLPGALSSVVLSPASSSGSETWAAAALVSPPVPAVAPATKVLGFPVSILSGLVAGLAVSAPFFWVMGQKETISPTPSVAPAEISAPSHSPANTGFLFAPFPTGDLEDIITALAEAASGPSHALSRWRQEAIASRVTPESVRDLLDKALARDLKTGKDSVLRALLQRWASADPRAALDYVVQHDLDRNKGLAHAWSLFTTWSQKDARAASKWLLTAFQSSALQGGSMEGTVNAKLAAFVLEQLVRVSHADAIAFAEKLPPGPALTAALKGLAGDDGLSDHRTGWTRKQREQLADSLAEACRGPLSSEPFRRYLTRWASRDEAAVSAWLERQKDPAVQLEARLALLAINNFQVPTGPMSYTSKKIEDREARADSVVNAAAGILSPDETLTRIAAVWPAANESVISWLTSQKTEGNPDAALALVASRMADSFADRRLTGQDEVPPAFSCAEKIQDSALREQVLCGLYRRWSAKNAEAAAAFLETSGWPAERLVWLKSMTARNP